MRRNPRTWPTSGVGIGNAYNVRWRSTEDEIVAAHYPDFDALMQLLPNRSRRAISARAGRLGITKRSNLWKTSDCAKLRRLRAGGLTVRQLLEHFPGRSYRSIEDQLRERQIFIRRAPVPVKDPLLAEIRRQAFIQGVSLAEVGRRARARAYNINPRRPVALARIAALASALGGELMIEWEPLE